MASARSSRVLILLSLSCLVCAACSARPAPQVAPKPSPVDDQRLAAGDKIEVRVYGEKELSGTHRVGSDGNIQFPLVGAVQVSGKSHN